ncbi:leucine-rich repeat domain-containing protein [Porphyromonas sp.]|uniref:leucine-rich repeat domain-containing protein n=1 Tax=Porphyromonas sp. TaxID=1924944 RepID=UPI003AAB1ABF
MCKHLRIWLFALLATLLASNTLLAQGVITMTTSKAVGETILLRVVANGNVSIEGALETGEMNEDGFKFYTIKSQTITIRGDVTELDCNENQLTSLNVSKNTALTSLECSYNQLTSLDVSKNTALEELDCFSNQLTSLDVSKNTALEVLNCFSNQLTSLEVSKNTALTTLSCNDNKLTNLNMSGCANLMVINCSNNYINGKAMTKLVNSLPNRRGMYCGTIFLVDSSSKKSDKNRCSAADVTTAKRKNWKVRQ